MTQNNILVVRGGGDLASGVIHRLYRCGYRVLILESARPSAIRREVSFCEAVYDGEAFVEGVLSHRIQDVGECAGIWEMGEIPLLVDETGEAIKKLHPAAVIDAILAKKNLGTNRAMAPLTIALGPGFLAGRDVDYVVETQRGHDLGRIVEEGWAAPQYRDSGNDRRLWERTSDSFSGSGYDTQPGEDQRSGRKGSGNCCHQYREKQRNSCLCHNFRSIKRNDPGRVSGIGRNEDRGY